MTVQSTPRKAGPFNGNGVTVAFPFTFKVFSTADVYVVLADPTGAESILTLTTDYTVALNADQNASPGGTVTAIVAPAAGYTLTLSSVLENEQPTDITNNGGFYPNVVEDALDRDVIMIQQLDEKVSRSLKMAISTPFGVDSQLPAPVPYALIGWNAAGDGFQNADPTYANALATDLASTAASKGAALVGFDGGTLEAFFKAKNNRVVDSIAALRLLDKTKFTRAFVTGYSVAGDGGGGPYWYDATDTTSTDDGGSIIVATDGGRWKLVFTGEVSVLQFGADRTGVADSASAIQAAIAAAGANGGGSVLVPLGLYTISTGLSSSKAVTLRAQTRSDITSNTNGSGATSARPTIKWIGSAGGYMYVISPAVVGDIVWGGGSVGIEWNGNDLAAVAVHLSNTKYAEFDGKVRQVTYAGVLVNSQRGSVTNFSMKNHIRSLEFVWGTVAACQNAHGLLCGGDGATIPATQQLVGDVSGLVYNGSLVYVTETDNAQFISVHASVQAGGTGKAVTLVSTGAQAANHNVFLYVVGPVSQDNGLIGNTFLQYNTESGGISQSSGSAAWHGELVDYVSGKRYKSHTYALRKKIDIPPWAFSGDAGTGSAKLGLQWQLPTFTSSGTGRVSTVLPPLYDVAGGVIEGVEIFIGTNGTSAGNYRLQAVCSTVTTGTTAGVVTPEVSMLQTAAAPAQYNVLKYTFTFSPELAIATDNLVLLSLDRLAIDAADTNSDDAIFVGARVLYRGTGPDSAGSGTYYIPAW